MSISPFAYAVVTFVTPALVLATGSKWSGPMDFPDSGADLRQFVAQWREKFRAAPDIVIVGGGAVGIELSGEIRDEYPVRSRLQPASLRNLNPCLGQEDYDRTRTG